jgi:hypothetical protein
VAEQRVQRQLSAILAADVAGYRCRLAALVSADVIGRLREVAFRDFKHTRVRAISALKCCGETFRRALL